MPSALPANKLLRIIPSETFDYQFQYIMGTPTSGGPVDLSSYVAEWQITWSSGTVIYNSNPPLLTSQLGFVGSVCGHISCATVGNSLAQRDGVFFGGDDATPANGIIDLVLTPLTTSALPWETAVYTLSITNRLTGAAARLLTGGITTVSIS